MEKGESLLPDSKLSARQERILNVYNRMRPYQKPVFGDMVRAKRWLDYLDMGMGKTLITMTAVMYLEAFPCMIVCPKSAMYVWEEQLMEWFGEEAVIYVGKPKEREKIWQSFAKGSCHFIITNYVLCKELGVRFGIIQGVVGKGSRSSGTITKMPTHPGTYGKVGGLIADEIQLSGLFNHKSETYKLFKKFSAMIPIIYLLTGTPYRRGVIDFYGPLSVTAPDVFDSYWKFVGKFCMTIQTGFGKTIERNPKDVVAFRAMLRQYASILKKTDYPDELPSKQRQAIPVIMDEEQARAYNEVTEQMYTVTDSGELIMAPGILSLSVRQRQLLVCPQELGLTTRGAALDTLVERAGELVENNRPFVIFTPFKKAIPWIAKALREEYEGITTFEITGGLTPEQFRDAWQGFQKRGAAGTCVLICVIKSSASFHATVADTCFFLGYEWDFNQNEQAEDRLNRLGQKNMVNCYYFKHRYTIDDDVLQKLNDKKFSADLILSSEKVFELIRAKMKLGDD